MVDFIFFIILLSLRQFNMEFKPEIEFGFNFDLISESWEIVTCAPRSLYSQRLSWYYLLKIYEEENLGQSK